MEGARTEKMQMEDYTELPPGFRFHPTDPELIGYLEEKVRNRNFTTIAIGEVDLNKYEPWDLKNQSKLGENVFYFYCKKDRKYPTGMKTNRATKLGFWKATGKDRKICRGKNAIVGMKKTLVFHKGRAPRGEKTGWIMHEYRLTSSPPCNQSKSTKSEWVVCRIFFRKDAEEGDLEEEISACPPTQANEHHHTMGRLPPLIDSPERTTIPGGCSYLNHRFHIQFPAAPSSIAYLESTAKSTVSFASPSSSKRMGCGEHGGLITTTSMAVQCKVEQDQVSATTSVALQCKDEKKFEPQMETSTSYDIASLFSGQNGPTDEDPHFFVEDELMDLSSMWNV